MQQSCCAAQIKRWLILGFTSILLVNIIGFFILEDLLHKKINHRYFQTMEVLEQINNVTIDNGKVFKK